jgi:uncharacterized protein YbjT (DUF2867 family)
MLWSEFSIKDTTAKDVSQPISYVASILFSFYLLDFEPQTFAEALNSVDKLFWLTQLRPNMEEGISYTNLIREAKKNGIRQIVKLSVFQFVGSIGRWHRYEEKIIEESGISANVLSPIYYQAIAMYVHLIPLISS